MFEAYDSIFARRAASYHDAMTRWPRARDREFEAIAERLPGAVASLCDVPAGGGYLHEHVMRARPGAEFRYVAVEPAAYFLERCPVGPGCERVRAAMENVPVAGGFDAVASLAALHHVEDKVAVYRELARLAGARGRVIVADAAEDTGVARFLNGFVDACNSMGHQGLFLGESATGDLERAGLRVLSDEVVDVAWVFETRDDVGLFAKALFGIDLAPPDRIVDALQAEVGLEDRGAGKVAVAWRLRYLTAVAAGGSAEAPNPLDPPRIGG